MDGFNIKSRNLLTLVLLLSLIFFVNTGVFADQNRNNIVKPWYITVGLGYNFPLKNSAQSLQINDLPGPPDIYTQSKNKGNVFINLEFGHTFNFVNQFLKKLEIGLALQTGQAKQMGEITQFTISNMYQYRMKTSFKSLLMVLHAEFFQLNGYHLSAFLGGGPSYNSFSDYNETPQAGDPRDVMFPNKNQWDFAYVLGFSFNKNITTHLSFGLTYEYLNAGIAISGKVKPTEYQAANIKLRNNILLLGVRYNF